MECLLVWNWTLPLLTTKYTITLGIYECIASAVNIFPYKLDNKVFHQGSYVFFYISGHSDIAFYFIDYIKPENKKVICTLFY